MAASRSRRFPVRTLSERILSARRPFSATHRLDGIFELHTYKRQNATANSCHACWDVVLPNHSSRRKSVPRDASRATRGRALVGQLEACHVDDASPGVCSVQLSATTRVSMTKTIKPPPGPTAVSMRMGCQLCSVRAFSSDCIAALLLPEISLNSDFCATLPPKEKAVRIIRCAGTFRVARAGLGRS